MKRIASILIIVFLVAFFSAPVAVSSDDQAKDNPAIEKSDAPAENPQGSVPEAPAVVPPPPADDEQPAKETEK
jgi:hypothetical protein